jgi:hypothetical protein
MLQNVMKDIFYSRWKRRVRNRIKHPLCDDTVLWVVETKKTVADKTRFIFNCYADMNWGVQYSEIR